MQATLDLLDERRATLRNRVRARARAIGSGLGLLWTWLIKYAQSSSRSSAMPARLAAGRMALRMSSCSSGWKRPGMLPEERRSFMKTRKRSSVIWLSRKRNATASPLTPHRRYICCRSALRSLTPYVAEMTSWYVAYPETCEASFERLCLPEPPTPTSRPWPPGDSRMREIRQTWCRGWGWGWGWDKG